jgi:hypothetical protein
MMVCVVIRLVSFYWAITTLSSVGYGDVAPTTHREMTYCVIAGTCT